MVILHNHAGFTLDGLPMALIQQKQLNDIIETKLTRQS